jgi:Kdo2-lipid IVA lauroyltransferase/acyltransferase
MSATPPVTPSAAPVFDAASDLAPPGDQTSRVRRPVVLRHRVQYAVLRALIATLGGVGFRRASNLGARIARLGYRPFGIRRRVVERQIAAAFPEWDEQRVGATALAAYENLGRTTIETALLSRMRRETILELFDEPPNWHLIERALDRGNGIIITSGHLGNWELGGAYVAARVHFEAVARQMENPLFDDYITRTRQRIGMRVIYDGDAVRRVPRVLRANGAVAFLIDQGTAGLASTWVPFFGRYAKTPRGAAVFALRLQTPVFHVAAIRKPDGRFILEIEEIPVRESDDRNAEIDRILRESTAALERIVRRTPEQYFWHHRRWKHQRPNTPTHVGDPL